MFKRFSALTLTLSLALCLGPAVSADAASTVQRTSLTGSHAKAGSSGKASHAGTSRAHRTCRNRLVITLAKAGFRGENLREAWAIAMRESGGRPRAVSRTHDYGLFQFNRATFSKQSWWKPTRLLRAKYSARLAHRLSKGGRTWYLWGLDGTGHASTALYRRAGWSRSQVHAWILAPYRKWYAKYPC